MVYGDRFDTVIIKIIRTVVPSYNDAALIDLVFTLPLYVFPYSLFYYSLLFLFRFILAHPKRNCISTCRVRTGFKISYCKYWMVYTRLFAASPSFDSSLAYVKQNYM